MQFVWISEDGDAIFFCECVQRKEVQAACLKLEQESLKSGLMAVGWEGAGHKIVACS